MPQERLRPCTALDPHAGFVSRAIAFIMDLTIMSLLVLIAIAFVQVVLGFFTLYGLLGRSARLSQPLQIVVTAVLALIGAVIAIGYPVGFWVLLGRTPGKALMGLCVVRVDGKRLTVRRALLRYLGYWMSAIPLFMGFWWVLGDQQRQGWHDKLAGTCVVYNWQSRHRQGAAT
jgi:uncharacterized RDD family membrane protein YckC